MDIELFPAGGWIYVIMTASDFDRVKIGKSRSFPFKRANNLKTGDPNIDSVMNFTDLETLIHQEFDYIRIKFNDTGAKSEWFSGYISDIVFQINDFLKSNEFPLYIGINPFENVISAMSVDDLEDYLKPRQLDENGWPFF